MKIQYIASRPRFSDHYGCEVVDILKRKKLFGFIPYWGYDHTIRNAGQVDEVILLLNNPNELKRRIEQVKS